MTLGRKSKQNINLTQKKVIDSKKKSKKKISKKIKKSKQSKKIKKKINKKLSKELLKKTKENNINKLKINNNL